MANAKNQTNPEAGTQASKSNYADLTNIISTGFQRAFTLKSFSPENPAGTVRRFPCCDHHDEPRFRVALEGLGFFLIKDDSRDNGFRELSRELLPVRTICSFGYYDDEHKWMPLTDRVSLLESQALTDRKKGLLNKLTIESLDSLSIGDSVCDMHYGLPSFGEDVREIMESCYVNVDVANSLIGDALTSVGLTGYHRVNKFLYVVGKDDAGVTCAYSYDGRYAKVIGFGLKR